MWCSYYYLIREWWVLNVVLWTLSGTDDNFPLCWLVLLMILMSAAEHHWQTVETKSERERERNMIARPWYINSKMISNYKYFLKFLLPPMLHVYQPWQYLKSVQLLLQLLLRSFLAVDNSKRIQMRWFNF